MAPRPCCGFELSIQVLCTLSSLPLTKVELTWASALIGQLLSNLCIHPKSTASQEVNFFRSCSFWGAYKLIQCVWTKDDIDNVMSRNWRAQVSVDMQTPTCVWVVTLKALEKYCYWKIISWTIGLQFIIPSHKCSYDFVEGGSSLRLEKTGPHLEELWTRVLDKIWHQIYPKLWRP